MPAGEKRRLRILLLLTQMEAGGAQNAAIKLAQGLEAQGHKVTIATMYDKAAYVPIFRQRHNVEMIDLRLKDINQHGPITRFVQAIRGVGALWRLMRRGRYDVLMTLTPYSNIIGPVIGWAAGIPVRVSSQRSLMDSYPAWVRILDRLITNSRLVDTMTSVSEAVRNYSINVENILPSKIIAVYTGIEAESYRPVNSRALRAQVRDDLGLDDYHTIIITVARLHPVKGHTYLIEAMPRILAQAPECRFILVGEGPIGNAISEQVRDAGLTDKVLTLGVRDDVPLLLAASDLMVLPSLGEGLPNVVLEAMAAGLPVVASAVGGNPELIIDDVTGVLVPPGDSEALADSILRLVTNQALAREMGRRGQTRVIAEFTATQTTARYANLFLQLLAQKHR